MVRSHTRQKAWALLRHRAEIKTAKDLQLSTSRPADYPIYGSDSVVSVISALRQLYARERKSLRAHGMSARCRFCCESRRHARATQ
jgi:hypothetical protein